ncbi:hypothetical protein OROMI_015575 [Orobanche minor]
MGRRRIQRIREGEEVKGGGISGSGCGSQVEKLKRGGGTGTGSGSGSRSQVKDKILVQGLRYGGSSRSDSYAELYIIDLKKNQVSRCPHTVFKVPGGSAVVALGSVIYLVGGAIVPEFDLNLPGDKVDDDRRFHHGASYLDLNRNRGWESAPPPKYYKFFTCPNVVAFFRKIYVFGYEEKTEVFDPKFNNWDFLLPPRSLEGLTVSSPVLPDPLNNRIFIHIQEIKALYAYYPTQDRWELFIQDFNFWSDRLALEDGVIYMYIPSSENVIAAYDITRKERLDVVLFSKFDRSVSDSEYDALLHLGNGVLCLVTYTPVYGTTPKTLIYTVKFRVQRRTGSHLNVLVTPISVESYTIEAIISHPNFVALSLI